MPGGRKVGGAGMAGGKLIFDKHTENLAEIAMVYADLRKDYPELLEEDSVSWKQMFVEWANEFESLYPNLGELNADYLLMISSFAKEKIFDYGGVEQYPWYFTFGSWEKYPYQSTYLVVFAKDERDLLQTMIHFHGP